MSTQKIAITGPPVFLKKLDSWVQKTGKSRSRFIVEELDKRLVELEDEEITRLYDRTYGDPQTRVKGIELAEEMLDAGAIRAMEDKW
jgi:endonuclease YncB( thermonuclease family)